MLHVGLASGTVVQNSGEATVYPSSCPAYKFIEDKLDASYFSDLAIALGILTDIDDLPICCDGNSTCIFFNALMKNGGTDILCAFDGAISQADQFVDEQR